MEGGKEVSDFLFFKKKEYLKMMWNNIFIDLSRNQWWLNVFPLEYLGICSNLKVQHSSLEKKIIGYLMDFNIEGGGEGGLVFFKKKR